MEIVSLWISEIPFKISLQFDIYIHNYINIIYYIFFKLTSIFKWCIDKYKKTSICVFYIKYDLNMLAKYPIYDKNRNKNT